MSGDHFSRMVYVGNLPTDVKEWEVEDLFYKYGRVLDIELKIPPYPPAYCFVEFQNSCDAQDAIRGRDGYNLDGCCLMVELAHGGGGPSTSSASHNNYGSGEGHYDIPQCRSQYQVIVRNLPSSTSWQDLKNYMQKAGDVCFAEVSRDSEGTFGLVDYSNYEDMKYAIRKLDRTEFGNPWRRTNIRVKMYERSRSRSHSRSRSPRNKSKSLERPVSKVHSRSKRSRSRSRSTSAAPVKSSIPTTSRPRSPCQAHSGNAA